MPKRIGYAVYSEIECGYLVTASPSNYLLDPAAALMYETAAKAWASANRRGPRYAIAVAIVRVRIPAKLNSHSGQREHPDP
ncbi:hypothetical protein RI534_12905 [Aeromonas allosaccharophila]|uniref:hypothetical protein n=1 Tax=Aeromonas allosaccharophila TaxID=656 RepID=UPI003433AFE9